MKQQMGMYPSISLVCSITFAARIFLCTGTKEAKRTSSEKRIYLIVMQIKPKMGKGEGFTYAREHSVFFFCYILEILRKSYVLIISVMGDEGDILHTFSSEILEKYKTKPDTIAALTPKALISKYEKPIQFFGSVSYPIYPLETCIIVELSYWLHIMDENLSIKSIKILIETEISIEISAISSELSICKVVQGEINY